jgi:hypothetical protein
MTSDWASSFDQIWRSPSLPIWLLVAIAGFVGLVLLVAMLKAERSVANGTLAVLTVVAIALAVIMSLHNNAAPEATAPVAVGQNAASLPALACLDDLAGEPVLQACEKLLFASPDSAAAAVAQTVIHLNRLTARGDVATADKAMTPDLQALRRAIERDRYGLVAYVLTARDRCKPDQCAAFASLTNTHHIAANMTEKVYEAAISRYEPGWNAPSALAGAGTAANTAMSLMAPVLPTGKPTSADFPSSASIPPVNIMTPEPPAPAARAATAPPPTAQATPPAAARTAAAPAAPAAPKKPPAAPKKQPAPAPVQLQPSASSTAPAARDQ